MSDNVHDDTHFETQGKSFSVVDENAQEAKDKIGSSLEKQKPSDAYTQDRAQPESNSSYLNNNHELPDPITLDELDCEEINISWLKGRTTTQDIKAIENYNLVYCNGFCCGLSTLKAYLRTTMTDEYLILIDNNNVLLDETCERLLQTILSSGYDKLIVIVSLPDSNNLLGSFADISNELWDSLLLEFDRRNIWVYFLDENGKQKKLPERATKNALSFSCPWIKINVMKWSRICSWDDHTIDDVLLFLERECMQEPYAVNFARELHNFCAETFLMHKPAATFQEFAAELGPKLRAIGDLDRNRVRLLFKRWDQDLIAHFLSCYVLMARFGQVPLTQFFSAAQELIPQGEINVPYTKESIEEIAEGVLLKETRTQSFKSKNREDAWQYFQDALLFECDFELIDQRLRKRLTTCLSPKRPPWMDEDLSIVYQVCPSKITHICARAHEILQVRVQQNSVCNLRPLLSASIFGSSSSIQSAQLKESLFQWANYLPRYISAQRFGAIASVVQQMILVVSEYQGKSENNYVSSAHEALLFFLKHISYRSQSAALTCLAGLLDPYVIESLSQLDTLLEVILRSNRHTRSASQPDKESQQDADINVLEHFRDWSKPILKDSLKARLDIFTALANLSELQTHKLETESLHSLWFFVLWHDFVVKSSKCGDIAGESISRHRCVQEFKRNHHSLLQFVRLFLRFDPQSILPEKEGDVVQLEVPFFYFLMHDCENELLGSNIFSSCTERFEESITDSYQDVSERFHSNEFVCRVFRNLMIFEWVSSCFAYDERLSEEDADKMTEMLGVVFKAYQEQEKPTDLIFDWLVISRLLSCICEELEQLPNRPGAQQYIVSEDGREFNRALTKNIITYNRKLRRIQNMTNHLKKEQLRFTERKPTSPNDFG